MRTRVTIFTEAETRAIFRRWNGEVSDSTGAFRRARDKLEEIQRWHTDPKMRKVLKKVLKQRGERVEEKAKPNDELTFDDFKDKYGY